MHLTLNFKTQTNLNKLGISSTYPPCDQLLSRLHLALRQHAFGVGVQVLDMSQGTRIEKAMRDAHISSVRHATNFSALLICEATILPILHVGVGYPVKGKFLGPTRRLQEASILCADLADVASMKLVSTNKGSSCKWQMVWSAFWPDYRSFDPLRPKRTILTAPDSSLQDLRWFNSRLTFANI